MASQSMQSLFNIARQKQQIQENEFNPYASATGALVEGIGGRLQDRAGRPGREADLFLKLLEVAEKQGAIKRQQEIDQRNQEMHQQLFGNLNTGNLKILTDKTGKGVNTTASLMEKAVGPQSTTHETTRKWNSKTGYWDIESKSKKESAKRSISEEVSLYKQKKEVEYDLKKKYGNIDASSIALEINRLADPYRDFGKEVNWNMMKSNNPKLYKTIQMLYDMHDKLRKEQYNPNDPLGMGLEE